MSKAAVLVKPGKPGYSYRLKFYDHLDTVRWLTLDRAKEPSETARAFIDEIIAYRRAGRTLTPAMLEFLDGNKAIRDKFAEWGIIDTQTAAAAESLADLLEQWQATRRAAGIAPAVISMTQSQTKLIVRHCRFRQLNEITEARFIPFLQSLVDAGKSARTRNLYLTTFRVFLNWAVKQGMIAKNPLANIPLLNEAADKRQERRELTDEEITALLSSIESRGVMHHGLTAHERALVYRLALETGLRWNEIVTLQRKSFTLDAPRPFVTVEAANAKNRRADDLPITPELAADLAGYFRGCPQLPTAKAFTGIWISRGAAMIADDLKAAGVAVENDAGEKIVFHSLRHTFATRHAKNGTPAPVLQRLMRHSSIELTMKYYTHLRIEDKAAAVNALPKIITARPAAALTGTLDAPEIPLERSMLILKNAPEGLYSISRGAVATNFQSGFSLNAEQLPQSGKNCCNHYSNQTGDFEGKIRTYKNGETAEKCGGVATKNPANPKTYGAFYGGISNGIRTHVTSLKS